MVHFQKLNNLQPMTPGQGGYMAPPLHNPVHNPCTQASLTAPVLHRACRWLWTAVGRRTPCSTELADVRAPHHVGCLNSEEDVLYRRIMSLLGKYIKLACCH